MLATLILATAVRRGAPPPPWLVPLLPVFFVALWLAITTVLGAAAGHMRLLARFPPVEERLEERFRFASGRMRSVRFNGGLYVALGARGLHIAPAALFRPILHRGVPCVPWSELRLVQPPGRSKLGLSTGARFDVPSAGVSFTLLGDVAERIIARLGSSGEVQRPRTNRLVREV